jgi:hypothetical protein
MAMRLPMKPSEFLLLGKRVTQRADSRCFSTELRRFRAFFGVSPSTCALLWGRIRAQDFAPRATPRHLLWGLMHLNLYLTEEVVAGFLGVDEGTYREWSFLMVQVIGRLKPFYVSLGICLLSLYLQASTRGWFFMASANNFFCCLSFPVGSVVRRWRRLSCRQHVPAGYPQIKWSNRLRGDVGVRAKVSVDGTDFRLPQQHPNKHYFSHKFKTSGYRYEVALCIQTGDIVHINGPFPCGLYPDISIFR